MRRKGPLRPEVVVPPAILEEAKRALATDRLRKPAKCSVCGAETVAEGPEQLCWVCRRLKISAWRESDQQMPAQE
ncbi:MAG: hypothetical protein HYR60_04885 [Acidobacteria bacterium]|nr:hypothetical protein [Acidobacteriota bacterium]